MKEALKTYREKHNKIALVSHYHVIQVLLAEGFGKASEVLNPVDTVNAKPYWRNLAKLLKIR